MIPEQPALDERHAAIDPPDGFGWAHDSDCLAWRAELTARGVTQVRDGLPVEKACQCRAARKRRGVRSGFTRRENVAPRDAMTSALGSLGYTRPEIERALGPIGREEHRSTLDPADWPIWDKVQELSRELFEMPWHRVLLVQGGRWTISDKTSRVADARKRLARFLGTLACRDCKAHGSLRFLGWWFACGACGSRPGPEPLAGSGGWTPGSRIRGDRVPASNPTSGGQKGWG